MQNFLEVKKGNRLLYICRIQKMEVFPMRIIIGIDHGDLCYINSHCSVPAGPHKPPENTKPTTAKDSYKFGAFFVFRGPAAAYPAGQDRKRDLLNLAAIAKEIQQRGSPPDGSRCELRRRCHGC